jgi:hypothetical protein
MLASLPGQLEGRINENQPSPAHNLASLARFLAFPASWGGQSDVPVGAVRSGRRTGLTPTLTPPVPLASYREIYYAQSGLKFRVL